MKKIYLRGERYRMKNRVTIDKVTEDVIKKEVGDFNFKCTNLKYDEKDATYNKAYLALIPAGFDIETYEQFMYIWTFTLRDLTIIGYTWDDFRKLLSILKKALNLFRDIDITHHRDGTTSTNVHAIKALPIFIHYLEFEYAFLRSEINISEKPFYLDKSEHDPLYVLSDESFVFIDSYKVFPMKLEDVAKTYCITQKSHDLDYDKPRNYEDAKHLTEKELDYCVKDTQILSELMQYTFKNYFLKYGKMPMTQNQIIKSIIKKEYRDIYDAMTKEEQKEYIQKIKQTFLDQYQYEFMRIDGFRGAYCASSFNESSKGEIVIGADITSDYCSIILHKKFPMGEYEPATWPDLNEVLDYYCEEFCCQLRIRFINLRCKSNNKLVKLETRSKVATFLPNGDVPYTRQEQEKARLSVETNSSGRIARAANIVCSITEVDFELYKKVYEWDSLEVLEIQYTLADYLPDYVRNSAIKLYEEKSKLKKAGKTKSPEYKAAKRLVSNVYGAMVQRIDEYLFNSSAERWKAKCLNNILRPQWGVYVTAYARSILVNIILAVGEDCWLYSDTDSIYFIATEKSKKVIDLYNMKQKAENAIMCKELGLDYKLFDDLGCFDDESSKNKVIHHFKTIGVKSYLYYYTDNEHPDGAFELVLSGIPEEFFWKAYYKKYPKALNKEDEVERIFKFFNKNTEIEYTRTLMDFDVDNTDKIINGIKCHCNSGVKLVKDTIIGKLRDTQEIIAIENAFSEQEEATRLV